MNNFSPFPPAGSRFLAARWSAYAMRVEYGGDWPRFRPKRFSMTWGTWPFFCFDLGFFHGYIGWKPVNLHDAKFNMPQGVSRALPACEWSARIGVGARR